MNKTLELTNFLKELSTKTPGEFIALTRENLPPDTSEVVLVMILEMLGREPMGLPYFLTGILLHAKIMELENLEREDAELRKMVGM
jgi:hypothetical protein